MDLDKLQRSGRRFGGDFQIERLLKQGGFGSVFIARQLSTDRACALKVLRAASADPKFRQRWEIEAKIAAHINSDHVVRVLAAGIEQLGTEEAPWIAMELLQGSDFSEVLVQFGRLEQADVARFMQHVCHALGRAHALGIVHRDLKLENLFQSQPMTATGDVIIKILDFGIAYVARERRSRTERMGTFGWLAPEQTAPNAKITPATDVWALGLLLFTLYTGKRYWLTCQDLNEEDPTPFFRELCIEPLPPASVRAEQLGCGSYVPAWFDGWFARCVTRERDGRFADANAAFAAFREAVEQSVVRTPAPQKDAVDYAPPKPRKADRLDSVRSTPERDRDDPAIDLSQASNVPSTQGVETTKRSESQAVFSERLPQSRRRRRQGLAVAGLIGVAGVASYIVLARGDLSIRSNLPEGTAVHVYLDDQAVCDRLPCSVRDLSAGRYSVYAKANDHDSFGAHIEIESRRETRQYIAFKPLPATLEIDSHPPGAWVTIADKDIGTLPRAFTDLVPNVPHEVSVRLDGYAMWTKSFTLEPGQHARETVELELLPEHESKQASGVAARPPQPLPSGPIAEEPPPASPKPQKPPQWPPKPAQLNEEEVVSAIGQAHAACSSRLSPQDPGTLAEFDLLVSSKGKAVVFPSALLAMKPYGKCLKDKLEAHQFSETAFGNILRNRKLAL
jgi:serine/threonine protein kinase